MGKTTRQQWGSLGARQRREGKIWRSDAAGFAGEDDSVAVFGRGQGGDEMERKRRLGVCDCEVYAGKDIWQCLTSVLHYYTYACMVPSPLRKDEELVDIFKNDAQLFYKGDLVPSHRKGPNPSLSEVNLILDTPAYSNYPSSVIPLHSRQSPNPKRLILEGNGSGS
ncbi:hypothetical protein HAX54_044284 [Datura stramonium]|uniref:Uncharacterized protein n=1 Tax=Datura stramonium TaxID=4076 RepID=A0ABS8W424_DATST|nr:hypothetical protein [Datura stramonium]